MQRSGECIGHSKVVQFSVLKGSKAKSTGKREERVCVYQRSSFSDLVYYPSLKEVASECSTEALSSELRSSYLLRFILFPTPIPCLHIVTSKGIRLHQSPRFQTTTSVTISLCTATAVMVTAHTTMEMEQSCRNEKKH